MVNKGKFPTLADRAAELLSAIHLLWEKHLIAPSLILLYSTIDIMAWLDRPEGKHDVTRADFISWVDAFMLPGSGLPCSSRDLYSARCAILHSYSAESRQTRHGLARLLFYAWGTADSAKLQRLIEAEGSTNAVAVQLEDLILALGQGINKCLDAPKHPDLVQSRAQKFFANIPSTGAEL